MFRLINRWLVTGLAFVLILSACSPAGGNPTVLTDADNGKTVELNPGQKLTVILEGNPTTGYTWQVEPGESGPLKQVGEPQFEPSSSALGAGGKMSLQFEAASAGETLLKLVYRRPWEQGVPPEKTFEVKVIIK